MRARLGRVRALRHRIFPPSGAAPHPTFGPSASLERSFTARPPVEQVSPRNPRVANTVPRGPSAISLALPTLSAYTVTWNPAGTIHWLGACACIQPEAVRSARRAMHESAVMTEGFEIID